ncbi:MAG: DinB family protein [Candidatus Limnocylindrales bacterium]
MRLADVVPLFDYLYWLRDGALGKAAELNASEFLEPATVAYRDLRSSLVHELDVERSWRLRLQGEPIEVWDVELASDAYPDTESIVADWQREEAQTHAWLAGLSDDALSAPVTVNGLDGFPLSTYLVHVVMHGVESFSAVAILLHRAGHSVGDAGYLDFVDVS